MTQSILLSPVFRRVLLAVVALTLSACASGPDQPKPLDLGPNPTLLGVRQSWSAQIGSVDFSMQPKVVGQTIALVSSTGRVAALDARSGQQLWVVEPGFYFGAAYVSYGLMVGFLIIVGFLYYFIFQEIGENMLRLLSTGSVAATLVAPVIFRYSRIIYLYIIVRFKGKKNLPKNG